MLALLLSFAAHAAAPVEVAVPAGVSRVAIACPDRAPLLADVRDGVATFAEVPPDGCRVHLLRDVGALDGAGRYRCDDAGCVREQAHHAAVTDAPGRVNVVLEPPYDARWLELTCGESYRERADIVENTAVFSNVPGGECTLHFKGGSPARFRPVAPGTLRCSLVSSTAICKPISR